MHRAAFLFLLISAPSLAKDAPEPGFVYAPVTKVEFEKLDVNGKVVKPGLELLNERRAATFRPLVRLRSDFKSEMTSSITEVQ